MSGTFWDTAGLFRSYDEHPAWQAPPLWAPGWLVDGGEPQQPWRPFWLFWTT